MSETRIAGMSELIKGLNALPEELGKKAVWAALSGAGGAVRSAAVAIASRHILSASAPAVKAGKRKPGTVMRAIRAQRSKINKGQKGIYEVIVRVKPRGKKAKQERKTLGISGANDPDDPYYWWWLEFGTSKMAARPFIRPAFESTKQAQLDKMQSRMRSAIDRQAAKIAAEVNRGKA